MFGHDVEEAIKAHALAAYPEESCGVVTAAGYQRCRNVAADPLCDFRISPEEYLSHGEILGVAHSHPDGVEHPTRPDMAGQLRTAVPWALTVTDGTLCTPVLWWGEGVPVPALEEREFRHGPSGSDGRGDCYALIRDYYWLRKGIRLKEFPRDNGWWMAGQDMYLDNFAEAGFERVEHGEPDDVFLLKLRSPHYYNHGGILLPDGLGLHHLQWRLSAVEPIHMWLQHAPVFLRYRG